MSRLTQSFLWFGPLYCCRSEHYVLAVVGNGVKGKGASPIRLWMPRSDNVSRTISKEDCNECEKRRYKNSSCVLADHACMNGIESQTVIDWISKTLSYDD